MHSNFIDLYRLLYKEDLDHLLQGCHLTAHHLVQVMIFLLYVFYHRSLLEMELILNFLHFYLLKYDYFFLTFFFFLHL